MSKCLKNFELKKYTLTINVNELEENIVSRYQNYLPEDNTQKLFIDK